MRRLLVRKLEASAFFVLWVAILFGAFTQQANTQVSGDLGALSYQAFNGIVAVQKAGGNVSNLVGRLNVALGLIQEGRVKRAQGDSAATMRLEEQAHSTLGGIIDEAPIAKQSAEHESFTRALLVFISAPLIAVFSTFVFYAALQAWRWYDRAKLFEMRIVEKKTED